MSAKPDTTTTAPKPAAAVSVDDRIDAIERSVQTLSDGKWNKKDISAVFVLLGAVGGLASSAYIALQAAGVL